MPAPGVCSDSSGLAPEGFESHVTKSFGLTSRSVLIKGRKLPETDGGLRGHMASQAVVAAPERDILDVFGAWAKVMAFVFFTRNRRRLPHLAFS